MAVFFCRVLSYKDMAKGQKNISSLKRMKPLPSASAQDVREQFRRVLDSPEFIATESQRNLLQFVVSESLAGNHQDIKGFTLATRVLGRGAEFDQASDPIVSIHMSKLRQALERYYLTAGQQDPIVIGIPKGTYVPSFTERSLAGARSTPESTEPDACFHASRPSVLIRAFENLSGDTDRNYLGLGFAAELAAELSRYPEIRVLQYGPEGNGKRASDTRARFMIDGSILKDEKGLKVIVRLTDDETHELIWSDAITSVADVGKFIAFQEMVARIVAVKLASEYGVIPRRLSQGSPGSHPSTFTTYEAILRFYEYDLSLSPDSFLKAFEALEAARVRDPECSQVWIFLARLYATIFSLELPGFDRDVAERTAIEYAEKGVQLAPDDQRGRAARAYVRMLSDDLDSARREINLAYELNPNSLFVLDGIGYIMTLLGDWERGPALIRNVMHHNPYYRHIIHYALWVHALHRKDIEEAYQETMNLRIPALFWYPLAKAATLGLLGRLEEAKRYAADLLKLKPDFPDRGRRLISRFIKQDDIVQQVIEGLKAAGVTVA